MNSRLLCSDVLAIRCIKNFVLVAIGCKIHIFNRTTHKLQKTITYPYSCNIHGIVSWKNKRIIVYGSNSICTYNVDINGDSLTLSEHRASRLEDWIIATNWLVIEGQVHFAVLFAHNNVHTYDLDHNLKRDVQCDERCILYGGSISVGTNNDLVIFSGTVFQEILIWEIQHNEFGEKKMPILHRLTGHNGVIFSVIYDSQLRLICSTSDDRTVRLWKITENDSGNNLDVDWKKADVKLIKTMFGHAARVWRSVIKNETVITIGEDSLICMWSLEGKLLNKIYAHHGAAIWSIDVSDENREICDQSVFTGGADGSVHAWGLSNNYHERLISLSENERCNVLKSLCYLSTGTLLILNENGILVCYNNGESQARESLKLEKYSSYCIMVVSPCRNHVAFASRDGYVAVYREINDTAEKRLRKVFEERIMETQIFSLQWLRDNTMIVCGANGTLKVFSFAAEGSIQVKAIRSLPASRERWLTASIIHDDFLVCGDRAGNMHVFDLSTVSSEGELKDPMSNRPIQTFTKAHGRIGVQTFMTIGAKLMSAGRDGTLRFYEIRRDAEKKMLHALYREKMPMDWISGTIKLDDDILIVGFKEVEFVIYGMFHRRVLTKIPCGGGHRSWDCMTLADSLAFAYIRNKQVFVFDYPLHLITSPVLLDGFHAKEVYCVQAIAAKDEHTLLISGGEDGALRVTRITKTYGFETLGVFDGHISSIKCIAIASLKNHIEDDCYGFERYLIFSGGGRAQLKIWEIILNHDKSENVEISCTDLTSHMLYGLDKTRKKPWLETKQAYVMHPETRYMDLRVYSSPNSTDILLFVACADGFLRIFSYDSLAKQVELKKCTKCADRCILRMEILLHERKVIILTMSTDGIVRFFDFTWVTFEETNTKENDAHKNTNVDALFAEHKLHQSGINSFDLKLITKDEYLLATGGDDNSLNVVHFKIYTTENEDSPTISILSKWSTSSAHSAQITGVKFKGKNQICSVGIDQEVILYNYECSNNVLSARIASRIITSVADVQGLTLWPSRTCDESLACVYGKGFEILSI